MKLLLLLAWSVATVIATKIRCNIKGRYASGRIINGRDALRGEAPYIVALKDDYEIFCGGSIIDEHWILTTAHCLGCQKYYVIAGLYKQNEMSGTQIRTISSNKCELRHEGYAGRGVKDIGLIYIKQAFHLTGGSAPVSKISLASGNYPGKGTVYGWGEANFGIQPNTLQALDADVMSYIACKPFIPAFVHPYSICTYKFGANDGICHGDSGGPLVRLIGGVLQQVGVASLAWVPCEPRNVPTVYMSTYYFKRWIQDSMRNSRLPQECPQ